jgi:hypothetical protein
MNIGLVDSEYTIHSKVDKERSIEDCFFLTLVKRMYVKVV